MNRDMNLIHNNRNVFLFNDEQILGIGMSEKMWAVTHRHAWSCMMGNKHYIARGQNYIIILNPVCQVVKAVINGQAYGTRDLTLINRVSLISYFINFIYFISYDHKLIN